MPLQFGEFELDRERRQFLRLGQPVPLEPKAYELLSLLVERRPRALSRAQIRDVVWPGVWGLPLDGPGATGEERVLEIGGEGRWVLREPSSRPRLPCRRSWVIVGGCPDASSTWRRLARTT